MDGQRRWIMYDIHIDKWSALNMLERVREIELTYLFYFDVIMC